MKIQVLIEMIRLVGESTDIERIKTRKLSRPKEVVESRSGSNTLCDKIKLAFQFFTILIITTIFTSSLLIFGHKCGIY